MSRRRNRNFKKKKNIIRHLARSILKVFNNEPTKVLNYKQIASRMEITDTNGRNQIIKKLKELTSENRLEEVSPGKYILAKQSHYHEGIVEVTSRGNGYVICEDLEHDIYIPSRNLNKALHNDLVKVYVYKRKKNKKQEGDIVEILQRDRTNYVGVLQKNKNFGFVVPDDPKMYADIFIAPEDMIEAQDGDKVLAEVKDWPSNSKNPFGRIVSVLGKPGDHDTEIHSILLEYGLPYEFPKEVEDFARDLSLEIDEKEIAKRRDMRSSLTFTIDPKDAKDFDDALSFEVVDDGLYEIGVHIADVSHYVKEGTILDQEAYQRATSVYLVDRVVPMLPEILSNQACSLRPHEEKFTFSAVFKINSQAEIVDKWFGRTVTYSDHRFTYDDAQVVIESGEFENKKIGEAVLVLNDLAKKLRKTRMKFGAISFDKSEVKFHLDEKANPIGVYVKESKEAHKLIEEFMLLANRSVAEFIAAKKKTYIYRVHDEPDIDKLMILQGIISKFGYKIDTHSRDSISKSLNKLLKEVHGKAESNMIETLTIRSMSKAAYTTQNIGHYGLAFDHYTHFTSPIRRYPDVMAHRLLQRYLDNGSSVKADEYEEKCDHSSERETMATKAERDSIKYMQVKYMQNHADDEFDGVISGVTEWGIFVEILENKCEGMVRVKDITTDYFVFDEKQYALIGQISQQVYQLGDPVKVKVKHTDLERKILDFELID